MTPQEIFDYKNKWLHNGSHRVRIHSDLEWKAKQWCKTYLEQHQWKFAKYTNNYEDTFWFEREQDAESFRYQFKKAIDI